MWALEAQDDDRDGVILPKGGSWSVMRGLFWVSKVCKREIGAERHRECSRRQLDL